MSKGKKGGIDEVLEKLEQDPSKMVGLDVEDVIEIEEVDREAAASADGDPDAPVDASEGSKWPDWAKLPEGMRMPEGKTLLAVRFRAAWTDRPSQGDRVCILWNLTEADEKHASRRARGDFQQVMNEMAKQMIRVIDGAKADWSKPGRHNPATFFTDIGGACRQQLKNLYAKRHTLATADQIDFFVNCVAVRSVTG